MWLQTVYTLMAFVFPVHFVVHLIQIIPAFTYIFKHPAVIYFVNALIRVEGGKANWQGFGTRTHTFPAMCKETRQTG